MPLYWLCYRHNNSSSVVIEPAHSLIYEYYTKLAVFRTKNSQPMGCQDRYEDARARLLKQNENRRDGVATRLEGNVPHDRKWKVAKQMVGRRLTQAEAKRLLAKFE
jgi:hypothetical protein